MDSGMIVTILLGIIAVVAVAFFIAWFIKLPVGKKVENLKQWLRWAVVKAELALGSGTGQLKLRMVYDMAVEKFPWIEGVISFETFSKWVDEALDWLENQLQASDEIRELVESAYSDDECDEEDC